MTRHRPATLVLMGMPRHAAVAVVAIFAIWLSGCFLLPKAHGLHGGETLYLAEDSQVLEVMGPSLDKEDHRRLSRGRPLPVIAAGATVRVAADYEQQRELDAPGASLAHRNPWILVEVVESPVAAQRGWKGWIHHGTTKREPITAAPPPWVPLARASILCPHADSNDYQCSVNLAANSTVRLLGCAGPRVQIELFTDVGLYLHGFVNASQFSSSPCTTASKE